MAAGVIVLPREEDMRGSVLRAHRLGWLTFALLISGPACTGVVSPGPGTNGKPNGTGAASGSGAVAGTGAVAGAGAVSGTGAVAGTGTGGVIGTGAVTGAGTGGVAGVDSVAAACAASNKILNAGLTPARILTRDEFNNTVRDLLSPLVTGTPADALGLDERIGPFNSNAIAPIDETGVQQHSEVAAKLALAAKPSMKLISPCDLAADTTTTCATNFVTTFGQRAYRRALDATEIAKYVALYSLGKMGPDGALNGFRLVVETMLQSPFFLYHYDVGAKGIPQPGTVPLTAFELASRLSYFLWGSMPDSTLFSLATNGTLTQDAIVAAQVQRMITDPKAGATIALFHRQWLGTDVLMDEVRDAAFYPNYDASLADAMLQETAMFTDAVIRKGDGLLKTLLTSTASYPQGKLFGVYGVTQPAGFAVGMPVTLPTTQRSGILTQAAFLTRWSHPTQTSPVHRGKLIRLNVLCGTVLPPPPNANTTPPPVTATTSTRERFAQHDADPACAGCHLFMDPIGLGLENYDAIGAYRTKDGLGPVVATGNIIGVGADLAGPFDGAIELSKKLSESQDVADCFANQWFRFSMGRMESVNDSCSIQGIHDAFNASGGNIRDLFGRIASSPSFRNVRVTSGG
jgi:Protein of unknown function (DUF1592)/Protein of unknown function (DUF1588)/Protein of unknown function (DUF1595)/Protein of unknown function (DUF1585)/Protein of unknown function (DUF1587)